MTVFKCLSTSVIGLMAAHMISGVANGTQALPNYEAECHRVAADPNDPQRAAGYEGVPEGMLDILSAYRYCEAALRSGKAPSHQLQYQFARTAFLAGDIRMAQNVASRIDPASYPAVTGLILRIGMRNPRWANARENLISQMREAGRSGEYWAVDYHVGVAYEALGHEAPGNQYNTDLYEKALKAYEVAARSGVPNAEFKHAKMQLLHWNYAGQKAINETLATTMDKARNAGSLAAIFYQKAQAAVKAGAGDSAALKESLVAWRAAFEAGVPEAISVALLKDGVFGSEPVGVNDNIVAEKRNYQLQVGRHLGRAGKDPVLSDWLTVSGKADWPDWGATRQQVLEKAFYAGFTPAGSVLVDSFYTDPVSEARKSVLYSAALRSETVPYEWILTAAAKTFLEQENLSENDVALAAYIYRRLFESGEKRAALNGAVVMANAGMEEPAEQWLDGFVSAIQEPDPNRNKGANASLRRTYVRIMMWLFDHYGHEVPAAVHMKGLAADGENYASAVFEFISGKINHEPDLEVLKAWQKRSVAIAALDDRAREQYRRWVESRLATKIDYAEMRTKPKCEDYKLDYGGFDISASYQSFYITRYGSGPRDGGYRYLYKQDEGKETESFFLWLKASKKGDGPTGFRSKETWMRSSGGMVNLNFSDGMLGLGWIITLDDAGDIRARDRALRGGSTDLQYRLDNGAQHSLVYNFNGFRQAYAHARDKYRDIKAMADQRQCRTS